MQYEIFDDFKDGMPVSAVPIRWYTAVNNFIKGIFGASVIKVRSEGGKPCVTIDADSGNNPAPLDDGMKAYHDGEGARITASPFDGDNGAQTTSFGINGGGNAGNNDPTTGASVCLPTRVEHPLNDDTPPTRDATKWRMFFRSFGKSSAGLTIGISKEIGYIDVSAGGGKMGDSPVENNTNLPTNMATPASQYAPVFTNWDAGGENGVKMRLYTCTGVSGRHYWYPVDIEITNGGTIKSIRMVETAGERQAFQAG